MRKLRFTQKLWLPLLISLVALLAVSVFAAWQSRETRIEERKHDLMNVGQVGVSIVKEYAALAQGGAMSKRTRKSRRSPGCARSAMARTAISS